MRLHIVARKTHKWLGLFVGLQVVIWSLSGLYMTVVHIDTIHGDHLIREQEAPKVRADLLIDPVAIAAAHRADSIRLAWLRGRPIYVVSGKRGEIALDARTGSPVRRLGRGEIEAIAAAIYTGTVVVAIVGSMSWKNMIRTSPLWPGACGSYSPSRNAASGPQRPWSPG